MNTDIQALGVCTELIPPTFKTCKMAASGKDVEYYCSTEVHPH